MNYYGHKRAPLLLTMTVRSAGDQPEGSCAILDHPDASDPTKHDVSFSAVRNGEAILISVDFDELLGYLRPDLEF